MFTVVNTMLSSLASHTGDHRRLMPAHPGLGGERAPLDDVLFEIDGMDVGGGLLIDRHL